MTPETHVRRAERDAELQGLAHEVAQGSMPAMAALYARTSRLVYAMALRIVRAPACAEEIVSDVYLQAWRTASTYDPSRSGVGGWLLMMCRSRALDTLRSREPSAARDPATVEDHAPDPCELLAATQRRSQVHRCLAALPPQSRQLVALAFFRDYTHAQIAASCGLPLGTVKSQIRRALLALKRELAESGERPDA